MTDFADLVGSILALKAAEKGDLEPLAVRVESGSLTPDERTWLAGYLRGEIKRPRGRPAGSLAKEQRSQFKARFADKYVLDLFVWDYLADARAAGADEVAKKKEIAAALCEDVKSVEGRIKALDKHLAAGRTRLDYLRDSDCERTKTREALFALAAKLEQSKGN